MGREGGRVGEGREREKEREREREREKERDCCNDFLQAEVTLLRIFLIIANKINFHGVFIILLSWENFIQVHQ